MKRLLVSMLLAVMAVSASGADARVVNSLCSGEIRSSSPHACTFLLAGPITGTATVQPDEDGIAEVHLVILADPRSVDGTPVGEPTVLAECEASAVDEPATCTADWYGDLAGLPTPGVVNQSNGSGLPGRCIATGSFDGTFSCSGGSV